MTGRPQQQHRDCQARTPTTQELRILQANVQRGWPKHKCALETAFQAQAHVVLIQEPAIHLRQRRTQSHPAYRTLIPQDTWPSRPRVVTYIRKDNNLTATQPSAGLSRDLLEVLISGPQFPALQIWNLYNAPVGCTNAGVAINLLLQQVIHPNALVAGDFNIRHSAWDHTARSDPTDGNHLVEWTIAQGLRLLNPPEVLTHIQGGVLDLAFSNNPTATAYIDKGLHSGSDHETLLIQIAGSLVPPPPPGKLRLGPKAWDQDRFLSLLQHAKQPASDDIETEAKAIVEDLKTALQGSAPRTHLRTRGARWWSPECQTALIAFRRACRAGPAETERRTLQATVRKATRTYWRTRIEGVDSLPEAYRVTNWHKKEPTYQSPPMQGPDGLAVTTAEKVKLLHRVLLSRHLQAEDLPIDSPAVAPRTLPWGPIHPDEAYAATCQTLSTTPGLDEITASAIKVAWPVLGPRITTLFQHCLNAGVHPTVFKAARTVAIPKPGKRDRSLPKAYRPIALLPCLGKALERLIAKRMAFLALEHRVLARDQCSAIPRHSTIDLTTALYSDITDAWARHQVAGMVTIDVQGAFDSVLSGRLALRLRQQGWPNQLVHWVLSFLSGRTTQITLDGYTSEVFPLLCGLPQGSPVSPILFLLYIEPAISLSPARFGFADDGCLLAFGNTLADVRAGLQKALDLTLQWGRENAVTFEAEKTELQYFSPGRRKEPELPIVAGDLIVQPNKVTRWLGLFFDRSLRFKEHLRRVSIRARAATDHIKRLVGCSYGTEAALLRQAIQGTALATLFYGAETWFNNRTPIANLSTVQKAINRAARAVLPVYCTTPIPALLRETGWAPAVAWLERIHDRYAARTAVADLTHPVRARWGRPAIRWIRRRQALQATPPQRFPPWEPFDRARARQAIAAVGRRTAQALTGREATNKWLAERPLLDLTVYSDGALRDGRAGAGFCVLRGPTTQVASGAVGLGQLAVVYDAEVLAAVLGLTAALNNPCAQYATDVTVCLDNEEAAIRLFAGRPTATSAPEFAAFAALRTRWTSRPLAGPGRPGEVKIRWVAGHTGVPGNDRADELAGQACTSPTDRTKATRAAAAILAEARYEASFQRYWEGCAPARYQTLGIKARAHMPPELRLPRAVLGHLLAARSGHGDFADYHERFDHEDALLTCSCGARKAPEHFLTCPRGPSRTRTRPRLRGPASRILGTTEGAKRFGRWCTTSSFFSSVCPRRLPSAA